MTFTSSTSIVLLATFGAGSLVMPALAETSYVSFTDAVGLPGVIGPLASFTLNDDGSLAATVSRYTGALVGFGFNVVDPARASAHDFSIAAVACAQSGTAFGDFNGGWCTSGPAPDGSPTTSWTIGGPGSFVHVDDSFAYNAAGFQLYALVVNDLDGGAITQWGARLVPEATALSAMLAGLALIGALSWYRRLPNRRAAPNG